MVDLLDIVKKTVILTNNFLKLGFSMMPQCKPLEIETIVPSKRRLSASKWQRSWSVQFQDNIGSAPSLSIFTNSYFEGKGFDITVKVKSLKIATIVFEFEKVKMEEEIKTMFDFLTVLDAEFSKLDRVEDRLFNQLNINSFFQK